MPRQTTPPQHDPLPAPQAPYTGPELDVQYKLGRENGEAVINVVRDAEARATQAAQQATPVVNVTVPVPSVTVAAPVVNCTHGCVGHCTHVVHDDDGGTVLAFILTLVGFVLTWLGMLIWTDEAGWRCALTGVIVGGGIGLLYLAVTDGINRRWR
ncbi:MAG: hypothetical protein R3B12_01930 [Candidatus Saccharimonadales bacterium]